MYLHAGNNFMIREKNIIGIFDMDNATIGVDTKNFLKTAEKEGKLLSAVEELPKSIILYLDNSKKNTHKICISQISSVSLCNRIRKKERIQ